MENERSDFGNMSIDERLFNLFSEIHTIVHMFLNKDTGYAQMFELAIFQAKSLETYIKENKQEQDEEKDNLSSLYSNTAYKWVSEFLKEYFSEGTVKEKTQLELYDIEVLDIIERIITKYDINIFEDITVKSDETEKNFDTIIM